MNSIENRRFQARAEASRLRTLATRLEEVANNIERVPVRDFGEEIERIRVARADVILSVRKLETKVGIGT